jgi:two-component system chemotaxis sensor kinase CheA
MLEPSALVAAVRVLPAEPAVAEARPLPILIVDDSLTTRMLEQSILESAGYDVDLASSAEEALTKVEQRAYSLFLVDVEMPGMDGFGFIAALRAQPQLAAIPAILVTSRNRPDDRQRGTAVGAQGYVVKGDFDQTKLLAMIRRLVRG